MRFHVLGLGPVGCLLAHNIRLVLPSQHAIALIHKTKQQAIAALDQGGTITVEHGGVVMSSAGFESEIFETSHFELFRPGLLHTDRTPLRARTPKHEYTESIESLFITTKAHSTLGAVRKLLPRLSGHSTIVLLQNGMGIYEQLVRELFQNPKQRPHFILASNTHGAWAKGFYGRIVHSSVGEIVYGIVPDPMERDFEASFSGRNVPASSRKLNLSDITSGPEDPSFMRYRSLRSTAAVLSSLQALNPSWKPIAEVLLAMQKKLVVNCVINPLTALMGCRNGDIFTQEASRRIARRVCQEAARGFAAQILAGHKEWFEDLRLGPDEEAQISLGRIPGALRDVALEREVYRVAGLTKMNISSMLADVRKGKRTEIEYMNGYLLSIGARYKVPMPATATLLNLVKMRSAIPLDQSL